MKKMYFLMATLAVAFATTMQTACSGEKNQSEEKTEMTIVINLDSIVINPFIQFGASLADVEKYMSDNFADYFDDTADSLDCFDLDGGPLWSKCYIKGMREIWFFFDNADGNSLQMVSYDFYFPIQYEKILAELERNGFTNKGEIRFDDYNADITYLFLSPDGSIEAMPSYWEMDGGSWALSFQLTNDFDLQHLVNK